MSNEYPKINSIFKRDPETHQFTGEYSRRVFEYLADKEWEGTEKVDGTNVRLKVGVINGKTDKAQLHGDLVKACIPYLDGALWGSVFEDDAHLFTLYGEGYGAGIQKGGLYRPDKAFVLFDVSYTHPDMGPGWLCRKDVDDIANKFGMPAVPVMATGTLDSWVGHIKAGTFKESQLHPGAQNEGVVLRPTVELRDRMGARVITKLKFKDFA